MHRHRNHPSRFIFLLLFVFYSFLLVSCRGNSSSEADETITDSTSEESVDTANETDAEEMTSNIVEESNTELSDLFTQVDDTGILLQYGGDALEELDLPEISLFEDQILLWEAIYSESELGVMTLALLNPSTGEITVQEDFECDSILYPQIVDDVIFLCDSGTGWIQELDENLQVVQEWQQDDPDYSAWYIGADGTTLYRLLNENELVAVDLETEETETVYSTSVSLYGSVYKNSGVDLSSVDGDLQLSSEVWLDLATGTVSAPPFSGAFDWVTVQDGVWLACMYGTGEQETYYFGEDEDPLVTEIDSQSSLMQTEGGDMILCTENEGKDLTLYDASGTYVSSCTLPADDTFYSSSSCIWSEAYQGYFLLAYAAEGMDLFFWDMDVEATNVSGEDLTVLTLSEVKEVSGGEAVDTSLYEQAEEIGASFGVEVRIADQCETVYEDFTAEQCLEETLITEGLEALDEALQAYPDNFFDQLKFDHVQYLQFDLTGTITATNANWGEGDYSGFGQEEGDTYIIVIDLNQLEIGTFYHEISHVMDQKLDWDSSCRLDALYLESDWEGYNPEDFEYTYLYDGWWNLEFEGEEEEYFIDTYSMISPTEDRARIIEYAMNGNAWIFEDYEKLADKLAYYSACIRDTFDDSTWPEVVAWEEALN